MKVICAAILTLFCVGCSNTCKDGSGSFFFWSRGNYKACGMGCASSKTAAVGAAAGAEIGASAGKGSCGDEPPECRCSTACPCWKRHN